jgi:hypothetical protein
MKVFKGKSEYNAKHERTLQNAPDKVGMIRSVSDRNMLMKRQRPSPR